MLIPFRSVKAAPVLTPAPTNTKVTVLLPPITGNPVLDKITRDNQEKARVEAERVRLAEEARLAAIEAQRQAELAQAAQVAAQRQKAVVATPSAPQIVSGCGDNAYASFIYMHESGCNLTARNAGGCLGIGQACPGSKLLAVCPDLSYACQNAYFTAYASRYGGWAGSYDFWLRNHWW